MNYLIIGDIHGNLPALELVLSKEQNNYDVLISHGDVVNYAPWSNECVELLDALPNTILLKGNHETYFIEKMYPGIHPIARAFFDFNIQSFEKEAIIKRYGDSCKINEYNIQHTIDGHYIFQDTEVIIHDHYIIGHSHQQFCRQLNGFKLINTGSVGQNRTYINEVNYLLFHALTGIIEYKRFIYDHHVVINELKARFYPPICIEYYANKKCAVS